MLSLQLLSSKIKTAPKPKENKLILVFLRLVNWSSLHLWRNSWPKIEQLRWADDFASGHLTWSNEIRSSSYRRVCQYAVFPVVVHLMLLVPRKPQNSMFFMLAQRRLCVCLCVWSIASLHSQSEQDKFVGLRCTRKGKDGVSYTRSVRMLSSDAHVFKRCGYREDFYSSSYIPISCPYIAASEKARIGVKLFRRNIANTYSLGFFPLLLCCFISALTSAWFFPTSCKVIFTCSVVYMFLSFENVGL